MGERQSKCLERDFCCIGWWHQNIWLHFAVASHAFLSCPVLLIWPVYTVVCVMSVTPTLLPMWTDRPLSHTSVHTCRQWRKGWLCNALCAARTHTHTCVSPSTCAHHMHVRNCSGWCAQTWDPGPGGNDRFRGCCGRRRTEAGLWRICVTCNMQRWCGVMTSSV